MRKRIVIILVVFILFILSISIFTISQNLGFDTYNAVEYTTVNEESFLVYRGDKYYRAENQLFDMQSSEDDVVVAWYINFPFTGAKTYYSYSKDRPSYIFCDDGTRDVWIREDYNYVNDIFVIDGTDAEILYEKALSATQIDLVYSLRYDNSHTFVWRSKEYPNLRIYAEIFCQQDGWYMKLTSNKACKLTDDFVDLLINNGLIQ